MRFVEFEKNEILYPVGSYLDTNLNIIYHMAEKINSVCDSPDCDINLWCRGSSGAIISAIVATKLKRHKVFINHVKKPGESSHSECFYNRSAGCYNVVIDDFIRSGATLLSIIKEAKKYLSLDCLCISGHVAKTIYDPLSKNDRFNVLDEFDTIIAQDYY